MQSITNVHMTDGNSLSNKNFSGQQIKVTFEKRVPLWRRFFRLPIRSSVRFLWNLITMFQFVLPLNITSRIWGWVNGLKLPVWTRIPIYHLYSFLYRCNLDEMLDPDLKQYSNLSEFFRRSLKAECRPIDNQTSLVSPVDGRVLSLGPVNARHLHNVKGIAYTLKGFLGPANWQEGAPSSTSGSPGHFASLVEMEHQDMKGLDRDSSSSSSGACSPDADNEPFIDDIKHNKKRGTRLFHCIIYLAPGDYHKFHSPADWTVTFRRHFPGKLFSVNPLFTSWIKNLFCLNERAVYVGSWPFGFFSLTAVGANNVGSITVHCDPQLKTNKPTSRLVRGAIRGWRFISRTKGDTTRPRLQQRYYDHRLPGVASDGENTMASGDENRLANGAERKLASCRERKLTNGSESKLANGGESKLANGGESKLANGGESKFANGGESKLANEGESKLANGGESKLANGGESKLANGGECKMASGETKCGSFGIPFARGDEFGEFNFGSTVVLIFEAPDHFKFSVDVSESVKYGQSLGRLPINY